jgi:hypothetical protein
LDKGYKLHAIWGESPMPEAFRVEPMNRHEQHMAEVLIRQLSGQGYLLADGNYDKWQLYDLAAVHGHQLVAPRAKPGTGLRHGPRSLHRIRSIDLLEGPSEFGRSLHRLRRRIESEFAGLISFGGGLSCLPPWARGLQRVRLYVHGKLLVNAARIRTIHRRRTG